MIITTKKSTIALVASAAFSAGLVLSPMIASADTNPFASTELSSGYMQLAEVTESLPETKLQKTVTEGEKAAEEKTEMRADPDTIDGLPATDLQESVTEGKNADKTAKEAKCGSEMK